MIQTYIGIFRTKAEHLSTVLIAVAFALSGLMPIILMRQTSAAQLTTRSVAISTSQPSATGVSYSFSFTTATATTIQSMSFQFCDTPLGTCNLPGGAGAANKIDVSQVTANSGSFTGTTATAFADYTGASAGGCTGSTGGSGVATMFCATRTEPTSEAAGAKTYVISNITNPSIPLNNYEEIYIRIVTYSDTAFATPIDSGTVAADVINQLTTTGRVQERLIFCVFALDDAAGASSTVGTAAGNMPANCTASEANASTNVDVGVITNTAITRSPVANSPPASLGNARFGAALVNTNASNGLALQYYATQAASGTNELRAFRVPGASCNVSGTSVVDQCFISAASAGEVFTAGTERFGLQIACVTNSTTSTIGTTSNLGKTAGAYVNGSGSSGSYNAAYNAGQAASLDDVAGTHNCQDSALTAKYAWNATGTATPLISSATVIDNELVKMRFGATASATTPTGNYTVASTYIATPTF